MIIGMISTRFSGLDGVSLEAAKVAQALRADGHRFVWFGGELGPGFEPGTEYPAAHFDGEANRRLQGAAMGWSEPMADLSAVIEARRSDLRDALLDFTATFSLDALMIQNASAIPMQLPLGLAIADVIEESGLPSIAHHHDFAWERERFGACAVPEVLERAFPPVLPNLEHVVINQDARDELRRRCGVEATVLPNVMDFATPRPQVSGDSYRTAAGLTDRDVVLLQPTRVIRRKGIELTLQLAEQLADPNIKVVVTHPDDLDTEYWAWLQAEAARRRSAPRLRRAQARRAWRRLRRCRSGVLPQPVRRVWKCPARRLLLPAPGLCESIPRVLQGHCTHGRGLHRDRGCRRQRGSRESGALAGRVAGGG
jgi:hypothetical protein